MTIRFPYGKASRFCKPRISTPKQQFPTHKIKTFPKGRFEVLQTSNQRTQNYNFTQTQLNPLPLRGFSLLLPQHFSAYGGVPAGTARSAAFPPPLAVFETFLPESLSRFCKPRFGAPRQRLHKQQNAQKASPLFGQLFGIAPFFPFFQKNCRKSLDKSLPLV